MTKKKKKINQAYDSKIIDFTSFVHGTEKTLLATSGKTLGTQNALARSPSLGRSKGRMKQSTELKSSNRGI